MSLLAVARSRIPQRSLPLTAAPILHRLSPRHTRSVKSEPAYPGHIPLNWFENAFLAVGSAFMSLADPRRAGQWHDNSHRFYVVTSAGIP
jgi:ubiquinone biosynthesis protein COQ4